VETTNHN